MGHERLDRSDRCRWLCAAALALACAGACATTDKGDDDPRPDGSSGSIDARGGGQCGFCNEFEDCCGGFCIDTRSNRNNCGDCNVVCDPTFANDCTASQCTCNFGPACTGTSECCSTGCKDLTSDDFNCGACGNACGPNEACVASECVCAGTGAECAPGQQCCSDGCTDVLGDKAHCGECEKACDGGDNASCTGGSCGCSLECPAGALVPGCCADGCVDLCSDAANCGGCGAAPCEMCVFGGCADDILSWVPLAECVALP